MNERFLRLISSLGWKQRTSEPTDRNRGRDLTDYIKVFDVVVNGVTHSIPISVYFWALDKDEVPTKCQLNFVLDGEIRPRPDNRSTSLKSSGSIICMLDHAGYMTALKYTIYSHRVAYFRKSAKAILANQTII